MSDQLPGTTVTNGRGDQERVSLFAIPGTAEEEVPLWQLFVEAPAPESPGTSSVLDLTTATLDDENYEHFSFLLDDYKNLRVAAGKYKVQDEHLLLLQEDVWRAKEAEPPPGTWKGCSLRGERGSFNSPVLMRARRGPKYVMIRSLKMR